MSKISKRISLLTNTVIRVSFRLILYALILFVLFRGSILSYQFGYSIFYASPMSPPPGQDVDVIIPAGTDSSGAAKLLRSKGLIGNELAFIIQARLFNFSITPGEYLLNTSLDSREILSRLNEDPKEEE